MFTVMITIGTFVVDTSDNNDQAGLSLSTVSHEGVGPGRGLRPEVRILGGTSRRSPMGLGCHIAESIESPQCAVALRSNRHVVAAPLP